MKRVAALSVFLAGVSCCASRAQDLSCGADEMFSSFRVGGYIRALAYTDFNGDGRMDVAACDKAGGAVRIGLALGAGAFELHGICPTIESPTLLLAADVTGDGLIDLVVGSVVADQVSVLAGDGTGVFVASGTAHPVAVRHIDVGHFGSAREPRIVVSAVHSERQFVYSVSGSGSQGELVEEFSFLVPDGIQDIEIRDVDRDRLDDIVFVSDRVLGVYRGLPGGGIAPPRVFELQARYPRQVIVEHFDGDGIVDFAVVHPIGGVIAIHHGVGDGSFVPSELISVPPGAQFRAADLDTDGLTDLVGLDGYRELVMVMLNAGDGSFASHTTMPDLIDGVAELADIDGDLDLDLGYVFRDELRFARGDGTGHFDDEVFELPSIAWDIASGDFNNDGVSDVVTVHTGELQLFHGAGDGRLLVPVILENESHNVILAVDFDDDGRTDIATTSTPGAATELRIRWNDGDGYGDSSVSLPGILLDIHAGDLDADNDRDLMAVVFIDDARTVLVVENLGSRLFGSPEILGLGLLVVDEVAAGDMTGDGVPDLVATHHAGISVFTQAASGEFTETAILEFHGIGDIRLYDYDGDDDLDVVAQSTLGVFAFPSNGDGTLTGTWILLDPPLSSSSGYQFLDLDLDGADDLLVRHSNGVRIGLGLGSGEFGAWTFLWERGSLGDMVVGDFDRTGTPDLAFWASFGGGGLRAIYLLMNQCRRCAANLDAGDDHVGLDDLSVLLSAWGTAGAGADLAVPIDTVDFADLLELLGAWGPCSS